MPSTLVDSSAAPLFSKEEKKNERIGPSSLAAD
jgi:hypothetical protein